jgi:hypothetical protein
MADNIEKSAAETMAGSHTAGKTFVKDTARNLWLFGGGRNNSGSNSGSSSSSSRSSGGGDEWTAERYKNHNEYKENEHRRTNESADSEMIRHNTNEDARFIRKNTTRDLRHVRDKDTMDHAAKFGQMANMDLSTPKQRKQITFRDTPVSETNPGNGAGNQGGSTQQGQPGGRKAPAGKGKPREKSPLETRYRDEDAKGSQDYVGTTLTAKQWAPIDKKERRDVANSYVTKGDKLTPAQKRQNTAARSYATPFKPGTTAGQAKTAATKPRGKKA